MFRVGNRVAEPGNSLDPIGADMRRHLVSVTVYKYSPHNLFCAADHMTVGRSITSVETDPLGWLRDSLPFQAVAAL